MNTVAVVVPSIWTMPGVGSLQFFGLLAVLVSGFSLVPTVGRLFGAKGLMAGYRARAVGWWWVCGATALAVALGPMGVVLLVGFCAVLVQDEVTRLGPVPRHGLALRALVVAFVASAAVLPLLLVVAVYALLVGVVSLLEPQGEGRRWLWRAAAVGAAVGSMTGLLRVSPGGASGGWPGWYLFVAFMAQFNDLLQYSFGKPLGGRVFGARRPAPVISPNKTWEGFLGGALLSTLVGGALSQWLTPLSPSQGMLAGAAMATLGLAGDLSASWMKRQAGVKDAGTLLPGFGGMLDRVDSMIYVGPMAVLVLTAVG